MKKITFLMAMVFAMVMNLNAGTRTIYLDANIWETADAVFSAWVWGDGIDGTAISFTKVEEAIYKAEINDALTSIIFLRNDPAKFDITNPWNAEWNRADTGIPTDGNDMFRIVDWKVDPNCEQSETVPHCPSLGQWTKFGTAVEYEDYNLYVNNQTTWEQFYIYAWGNAEAFGGWPGISATETVTKDGATYTVYPFKAEKGGVIAYHLIIHNNLGEGSDTRHLFDITEARDYYLTVTDAAVTEGAVEAAVDQVTVDNKNAVKFMQNGQLLITRGGEQYTLLGVKL